MDSTSSSAAVATIVFAAQTGVSGTSVHLANAYTLSLARRDRELRTLLESADHVLPDGKSLVLVGRLRRRSLLQIRGPKLFEDSMDAGREAGITHYLLGSTPDTLARLVAEVTSRWPGVRIVGAYSPPFRSLDETEIEEVDERIRECGAQVVWVGLGTPKQDFEVQRIARRLPVVAVAVGAAFDFTAGVKPVAPEWMIRTGLEWTFRLISEPRRLWRRYLIGNAVFLWAALFEDRWRRDTHVPPVDERSIR